MSNLNSNYARIAALVSTTGVSACEADGVFVGGEAGDGVEVVISIAVLVGVKAAVRVGE